ncbi:hypothetical protein K0M31_010432 [Melipona bicolor]|uniref:Uncharacterized protein n=1 Tax=Melipona bicolor TaxID=60889 RepID=A0AA40KIK9_9HYME|nr:hypothetical protein K0M31_010432 [Melipona bicolor]
MEISRGQKHDFLGPFRPVRSLKRTGGEDLGCETVFPEGRRAGSRALRGLLSWDLGVKNQPTGGSLRRQQGARSKEQGAKSKEQGTAAAGVEQAAALGRVTCIACAPTGLGRCTRMHKGLKPRSMSRDEPPADRC